MNDWLNNLVAEIHQKEDSFCDNPNTAEETTFYEVETDRLYLYLVLVFNRQNFQSFHSRNVSKI